MEAHIICGAKNFCGFRVHTGYYEQKKAKFMPGVCARCGGPIRIVEAYTDNEITGATMVLDPTAFNAGKVVGI